MKFRFFIFLLLLAGFIVAAYFYVNAILIPHHLKGMLLNRAQYFVGRRITVENVDFSLAKGIDLQNVTIYQKEEHRDVFLHAESVHFTVLLPALFQEQRVVVPTIVVEKPTLAVIRYDDQNWNFSDLLALQASSQKKGPLSFYFGRLVINDANLMITDRRERAPVSRQFSNTDFQTSLSVAKGFSFKLKTEVASTQTQVVFEGYFAPLEKKLSAILKAENLDATDLTTFFRIPVKTELKNAFADHVQLAVNYENEKLKLQGELSGKAKILLNPQVSISGQFSATGMELERQGHGMDLLGTLHLKDTIVDIGTSPHYQLTGEAQIVDMLFSHSPTSTDFSGHLILPKAKLKIGDDKQIQGDFIAEQFAVNYSEATLLANGHWNLKQGTVTAGPHIFTGSFTLSDPALVFKNHKLDLQARATVEDLTYKGPSALGFSGQLTNAPLMITHEAQKTSLQGSLTLQDTTFTLPGNNQLSGQFGIEDVQLSYNGQQWEAGVLGQSQLATIRMDADKILSVVPRWTLQLAYHPKQEVPLTYSATVDIQDGSLTGFPQVDPINQIKGKLSIRTGEVTAHPLEMTVKESPVQISGSVVNWQNPSGDLQITAQDVQLEKWAPFFEEKLTQWKLTPAGKALMKFQYKGPLLKPDLSQIGITAYLQDAQLAKIAPNIIVNHISGMVAYDTQQIIWKDLTGIFDIFHGQQLTFNGRLTSLSHQPVLETRVDASQLKLSTQLHMAEGEMLIDHFKGSFHDSNFETMGAIHLQDATPTINMTGRLDLELADLGYLHPTMADRIKALEIQGKIPLNGKFSGRPNDWTTSVMELTATQGSFSLWGIPMEISQLSYIQDAQGKGQGELTSQLLEGKISLACTLESHDPTLPVSFTGQIIDADLSKLAQTQKWKDKRISGYLSSNLSFSGPLKATEKITGKGDLFIQKGEIAQLQLLKGVWKLLSIEEFGTIVFHEVKIPRAYIKENKLLTNACLMESSALVIRAQGWMDIHQNIDLLITPRFLESAIVASHANFLRKVPSTLLSNLANEALGVRLTGTLKEHKKEKIFLTDKVLNKTKDFLLDTVWGLGEEILEGAGKFLE
jgi:hypothetical protein